MNVDSTTASSGRIHPASAHVVELDVRQDLRTGREPFARIMSTVDALRDPQVLLLRTTFEPVPLFRVLGKRGFIHESVMHSAEDWSIWFWRPGPDDGDAFAAEPAAPARAAGTGGGAPLELDDKTLRLDVRGLEPPEPLVRTLAALETLPPGQTLLHVNDRVPQLLFPMLAERGFMFTIDESRTDCVLVRIWRPAVTSFTAGSPSHEEHVPVSAEPLELDVRVIAPRDKHPTIFYTFDNLAVGDSMIIVNDHDPRPLRYQFAAERPDHFTWTYQEEGPDVWRVRIDRR